MLSKTSAENKHKRSSTHLSLIVRVRSVQINPVPDAMNLHIKVSKDRLKRISMSMISAQQLKKFAISDTYISKRIGKELQSINYNVNLQKLTEFL